MEPTPYPGPAPRRRGRPPQCKCAPDDRVFEADTGLCMTCGKKIVEKKEPPVATKMKLDDPKEIAATLAETEPSPAEVIEKGWSPGAEVFLNLKGKLYLPARRRVQWMRGEPVPHPDWTIDTEIVEHTVGKFIRTGRVEGGYALVRANIYDETGRLIASGVKSEYSENFADYIEKAETGAIARAAAVAGYGTEAALDFDEGAAEGRIADSPVAVGPPDPESRPIHISPATAAPVGRGGSPTTVTKAQIRKVSALSSGLGLGTTGLTGVINEILDPDVDFPDAPTLVAWLELQSAENVGKLIQALELARDARS